MGSRPLGVGVIGCGDISASYLTRARALRPIEVRAVADLDPARAETRAAEFGVEARSVERLLASDDVEIVVNLTVPAAHHAVTTAILEAGRHAYSEKPLCLTLEEGRAIAELADARGLRVGCAPDTFLGAAHQEARRLLDGGAVGRIVHGTCHVMGPGMESWHPNPGFFFLAGGGPVLDVGPYYVAQLVNLVGPVRRVVAMAGRAADTRTVTSEPRAGAVIPVEVPTTVHAVLEFASGALVTLGASWDTHAHGHRNVELYGTEGSLYPQDPNFFGGATLVVDREGKKAEHDAAHHPLSRITRTTRDGVPRADWRGIGLADMADAIATGREHRCDLTRALHAVEVLTGVLRSAETGRAVDIASTCTRPEPLGPEAARALLAESVPA